MNHNNAILVSRSQLPKESILAIDETCVELSTYSNLENFAVKLNICVVDSKK